MLCIDSQPLRITYSVQQKTWKNSTFWTSGHRHFRPQSTHAHWHTAKQLLHFLQWRQLQFLKSCPTTSSSNCCAVCYSKTFQSSFPSSCNPINDVMVLCHHPFYVRAPATVVLFCSKWLWMFQLLFYVLFCHFILCLLLIYIAISDMQSPITSYLQQIYSRFPSHITKQIGPMTNTAMLRFSCLEVVKIKLT